MFWQRKLWLTLPLVLTGIVVFVMLSRQKNSVAIEPLEDQRVAEQQVIFCSTNGEGSAADLANEGDMDAMCGHATSADIDRTMNRPMTIDWAARDAQREALWTALNERLIEQGQEPRPRSEDFIYNGVKARMIELCQEPEQCTLANFERVHREVEAAYSARDLE